MTIVVNICGGPGVGKSSVAAGVFYQLKCGRIQSEYVPEFAKDLTWSKRKMDLACQFYVSGKQYRNIERLLGQVDVIVTDSPFFLSCVYKPEWYPDEFDRFIVSLHKRLNSMTYVLNRIVPYDPVGRNQDEQDARLIDEEIKSWLSKFDIPHTELKGDLTACARIAGDVLRRLDGRE